MDSIRLSASPYLGKEGMQIKDIQIEDLLQRDPIHVDIRKISSHIEGKRIMITGAAGSIGLIRIYPTPHRLLPYKACIV